MERSEIERLRAMEAAYQRERQQRDMLEKKYARLKRRYVRLERSYSRLQLETRGKRNDGAETPTDPSDTPGSGQSTPSSHTSSFAVIDLTSPNSSATSIRHSSLRSVNGISRQLRSSQEENRSISDDICAESPRSSMGSPETSTMGTRGSADQEEKEEETTQRRTSSDRVPESTRRMHLDFRLPDRFFQRHSALSATTHRSLQHTLPSEESTRYHRSPRSAHSVTTNSGEPRTQTRPRLRLHPSPERTAAHGYGYELEQEVEPRAHRHTRYRWVSGPSALPTTPSPTTSSRTVPTVSSPVSRSNNQTDEEASLALARYLQQQENIAAYEEYEARLRDTAEQEYQRSAMASTTGLSGLASHSRDVDPDNMTYEELLRLGEEVGDVKKERWGQMAVQVLSSLPTHRWTSGHGEDVSCIICQYNFVPNDRATTLPCAHVFHEDCVDGWIRENNSCPLCKREIVPL